LIAAITMNIMTTTPHRNPRFRFLFATILTTAGIAAGLYMPPALAKPQQKKKLLNQTLWLVGEWQHPTSRGILHEHWKSVGDSALAGRSFILKGTDTVVIETIRIRQNAKGLWYIPTVSNQNNGQPVPFKLKEITDSRFVFENREHDFPQQISYSRITADSMVAEISGSVKGKPRSERFPMHRSQ